MSIQEWYESPTRDTQLGDTAESAMAGTMEAITPRPRTDFQKWASGAQGDDRLKASMQQARKESPDLRAEVFQLQGKTGLPAELIQRNLDTVRDRVKARDFDPAKFRQEFPKLAGAMEDPETAALAHDDLDSLQLLERTLSGLQGLDERELQWQVQSRTGRRPGDFGLDPRRLQDALNAEEIDLATFQEQFPRFATALTSGGESPESLARRDAAFDTLARTNDSQRFRDMGALEWFTEAPAAAFRQGRLAEKRNALAFEQMMAGGDPELEPRLTEMEGDLGRDFGADGVMGGILTSAAEFLPMTLSSLQAGAETGAATAVGAGTAAAVLGQAGPQVATPEELFTVPGATAVGFAMGSRTGAAEYSFRQEAGAAYREYKAFRDEDGQPLDNATATVAASVAGGLSAGLELFGLETLVKSFPGGERVLGGVTRDSVKAALRNPTVRRAFADLGKRFAGVWSVETLTEVMQEGVVILGGEIAKGMDEGDFEGLTGEQLQARLTETLTQAAQGMVLLSAPGPVTNFAMDYGRARQARQTSEAMEALGEGARASKLRERLPSKYRDIVAKLREGGPIEAIQIPVERWNELFQSQMLDPAEIAHEVTGSYDGYAEAMATGGDVVIPVEAYAEKLAGGEFHDQLADNSRFRPGEMTPREAREWLDSAPEQVSRYLDEGRTDDPSAAVYDDVYGQLLAAGRERSTADREARLTQAVFRSLGERTGRDPGELFRQYNVTVTRPLPEVLRQAGGNLDTDLDPLIDRLRAGDIPTQQDAFGQSLLDFLRERGIRDEGGELAARDVDANRRAFQRAVARDDGMTLDDAAQAAAEAGYLEGRDRGTVTPDDLMAAIDRELRDEPVFSTQGGDTPVQQSREVLEQLGDYLLELGVDLDAMDNEAVKRMLRGDEQPSPAEGEAATTLDQSAFHGTPHRFDRFSLEAVGRGEGSQAYGWGLYFAQRREIAEWYRDELSQIGAAYRDTGEVVSGADREIAMLVRAGDTLAQLEERWTRHLDTLARLEGRSDGLTRKADEIREKLEALSTFEERVEFRDTRETGTLYEVDVPENNELLDWDAPFSQQPEQVQATLREFVAELGELHPMTAESLQGFEDTTGEGIYRALVADTGSDQRASRTLSVLGIPGLRYEDAGTKQGDGDQRNFVIWDEDRVTLEAVSNQLEQAEAYNQGGRQPRGRISFPQSRRFFNIELLEGADLSTFLHESGHLYLEILRDLAQRDDAPQQIRDDFQTILDWLGVSDADAIGTEQHEQWARGFEAYLREGRAPSAELRDVFARFKAWLVAIYRTVRQLDVELTDEVRGVMDRLVATDEEISSARDEAGFRPLFNDAAAAGMTAEEYEAYRSAAEQARHDAEDALTRRVMREYQRETRAWWREAKAQVREEVAGEVNQRPEYVAMAVLGRGKLPDGSPLPEGMEPFKLNKAALKERYGQAFLKRLPRPYVYSREGGVHPDVAAEAFGYRSGDEMVQALVNARPRRELIEGEVTARMSERFGDMLNDGSMAEAALEVVHNDGRAEVMQRELKALANRSRRPASPMSAIKAAAQRIVAEKRVRDLRPDRYLRAEQKASREAFDAVAAGDFAAATEAKQKQLLNHELYREARDARAEVEKMVDLAARFNRRATRERIAKAGADYLAQIDALLTRYEFRRGTSLRRIDRRQSLDAWIAEQNEAGFTVDVPAAVADDARVVSYKSVTVEELRGLRDAVRQIEHLARTKNRLLAERDRRDFEATVDSVVAAIDAHHQRVDRPVPLHESLKDKVASWASQAHAWHTKPEFLFRWLDGDREGGPVWRALFKPLADAEAREQDLQAETTRRLAEIMSVYTRKERAGWYGEARFIPAVGRSIDKARMLSIALNWGNQYNREVLMEGHGWSDAQVQAILSHLDARDWQVVQEIWDLVDSFWPETQRLEEELNGIAPEKVAPTPVETPAGTLRGGYYPIKYDTRVSYRAFQREEKAGQSLFENSFTRPATRKGHTKERQGSGGQQLRLDLDVLSEHIGQVIHDLSHRRAIIDVNRLAQNDQIRAAIEQTAGREMYKQIRPWLQSIANEVLQPESYWEKLIGQARVGATVVNMGLKVTTAVVQPLGYLNSVDMLGERYAWKGLTDFLGSRGGSVSPWTNMKRGTAFAQERSTLMRERQKTFDRDVRDSLQRLTKESRLQEWQRSFFYFTGLMDMAVSVPTWLGAYRKAMEGEVAEIELGDEPAAIDYADSIVRQTQSSGGVKDLAQIQRGGQVRRSFVMFYSYFSALYNQFSRQISRVKQGDISLPRLAASAMYLWFAPAILGELIAARGPDDDEEWASWAATQGILYPLGAVVGLRDVGNAVLTPFGYDASPAFDAFSMTARTAKIPLKALDEDQEVGRSDVKAAVLTAGYWGKLPARQAWITGEYLYDLATGEDSPESPQEFVRDLFFSRPADER